MKTSRAKWALIAALVVPGMMVNSCINALLMEVRDAAIGASGDFTRTTALDLLDGTVNPNGMP